jgi:low affinity Fe/Cu permease
VTVKHPPADVSPVSRALHVVTAWSAKPAASGIAALVSVAVLVAALVSREPETILAWFAAAAGAVTLVMVFVLQHTQTRQQEALHHKLDEVLHALPDADDRLIKLESASDSELGEVEFRHTALRDGAHEPKAGP